MVMRVSSLQFRVQLLVVVGLERGDGRLERIEIVGHLICRHRPKRPAFGAEKRL